MRSQHYGASFAAVLQAAAVSLSCLLSSEQRHKQLGMHAEPRCCSCSHQHSLPADETGAKADVAAAAGATELPIQLSAMRKADVSPFKGAVYVSIREYYEVGLPASLHQAFLCSLNNNLHNL